MIEELVENKKLRAILLIAWAISIGYSIYANSIHIKVYNVQKNETK